MHTKGKLSVSGSKLVCEKGYNIASVNSVGTKEGASNIQRLELCWNSHDALIEANAELLEALELSLKGMEAGVEMAQRHEDLTFTSFVLTADKIRFLIHKQKQKQIDFNRKID